MNEIEKRLSRRLTLYEFEREYYGIVSICLGCDRFQSEVNWSQFSVVWWTSCGSSSLCLSDARQCRYRQLKKERDERDRG